MSSYQLTYRDNQVFAVDIEVVTVPPSRGSRAKGLIYRVVKDAKESTPLLKRDGTPLVVHGITEAAALAIAAEVLQTVSGAALESVVKTEGPFAVPDFRLA
jgi:hypothetical protein